MMQHFLLSPQSRTLKLKTIYRLSEWEVLSIVSGALLAPTDSASGIAASAASPKVTREIGKLFKEGGALHRHEGKALHGIAQGIWAAAVAYAGGNNALAAGISAGGSELAAPVLSNWLYGEKDGSKLDAEQKQTVSAILGTLGAGAAATTDSNSASVTAAGMAGANAVENNAMLVASSKSQLNHNEKRIYNILEQNGAPVLEAFLAKEKKCSSDVCRKEVRKEYQKATDEFIALVYHLVDVGKLNYQDTLTLLSDISRKFLISSDKLAASLNSPIAAQEANNWTHLGILHGLKEAHALARYKYLTKEKGLSGKELERQLLQDAFTQDVALSPMIIDGALSSKVSSARGVKIPPQNSSYGRISHQRIEVLVNTSGRPAIISLGGKKYLIAAATSTGSGIITTTLIEGNSYKVSDLIYDASLGVFVNKGLKKSSDSMMKWAGSESQTLNRYLDFKAGVVGYGVSKAGSGTFSKFLRENDFVLIEAPSVRKNLEVKESIRDLLIDKAKFKND